jgi:hypothetical protein
MQKISIPKPCHEKWEDMVPQGNGSFCGQCSKVVVDFTAMTDEEVQNYFIQHAHEKLCGRFKSEQVNSINIEIPSYLIYTEPSLLKKFLLITLVVFGTTLYSCTNSEGTVAGGTTFVMNSTDTVPKEHTIGKIATPVDTTKKSCKNPESEIMGDVALLSADTIKPMGEVAFVPVDTVKKAAIDTAKRKK